MYLLNHLLHSRHVKWVVMVWYSVLENKHQTPASLSPTPTACGRETGTGGLDHERVHQPLTRVVYTAQDSFGRGENRVLWAPWCVNFLACAHG
jgi:hypothetical protein